MVARAVLTTHASNTFDLLARLERRGLAICGLRSLGGATTVVLSPEASPFLSALSATLPYEVALSSSADEDLIASGFSENELISPAAQPPQTTQPITQTTTAPAPPASAEPSAAHDEDGATHQKVVALLEGSGVSFGSSQHAAVRTSEEAAEIRGATLASGAKAMLLAVKPSNEFVLAVISASAKMDSKLMKKAGGFKSTRFASEEEVRSITGCLPGAVPPFGSVWGLRTFMDTSLQEQGEEINFNAGLRTRSVRMSVADYLRVESPTVCAFRG